MLVEVVSLGHVRAMEFLTLRFDPNPSRLELQLADCTGANPRLQFGVARLELRNFVTDSSGMSIGAQMPSGTDAHIRD